MVRVRKQEGEGLLNSVQEDTVNSEAIQTSLGVLQSASDFEIHGGNISSVGGDSTSFSARRDVHVVINHHHPPSPTPSISFSSSNSTSNSMEVPSICRDRYLEDISQIATQQIPTVQRNCDIYRSHLATKGRGLPLWVPEPSQGLPIQYQRQGISMGDVGVVTISGGFLYLFNIFQPENHPVNPRKMPEGFKPLKLRRGFDTLPSQRDLKVDSYLASPANIRARRDRGTASLIFESSESEGAILTMPVGAKTEDLPCLVRLRKYVTANLASWYRYARLYLGMDIENGDLKIVTGCDKTSAWGMACLGRGSDSASSSIASGSAEDRRFYLEFGPTENSGSHRRGGYEWAYSGEVAEVRAGPDSSETEQLRLAMSRCNGEEGNQAEEGSPENYENQCLFLRTMNPTLPEEVWQEIMLEEEQDSDFSEDDEELNEEEHNHARHADHPSSPSSSNINQSSPSGHSSNSGTTRSTRSREDFTALDVSYMPLDSPSSLMSFRDHPSIAINKYLLQNCSQNSTTAISLDQDWMSVLREHDTILPTSEELVKRILESRSIREEDGVVFFDTKYDPEETIQLPAISQEAPIAPQMPDIAFKGKTHNPWFKTGETKPNSGNLNDGRRKGTRNSSARFASSEASDARDRPPRQGDKKKKALLVGINYSISRPTPLDRSHKDFVAIKRLLEDSGYNPDDIVVLHDSDGVEDEVRPTRENIISQMRKLVENARSGDQFFFHFSGHSAEQSTYGEEEDGKDEYIFASDGKTISDDELKTILVDPLPPDCSLVGIFDSCHSGTLLDLPHYKCNRAYLPWVSKKQKRVRNHPPRTLVSEKRKMEDPRSYISQLLEEIEETGASSRRKREGVPDGNPALISDEDEDTPWRPGRHQTPFNARPESAADESYPRDDNEDNGDRNSRGRKPDVIFLSASNDGPMDGLGNYIAECLLYVLRRNVKQPLDKIISYISNNPHLYTNCALRPSGPQIDSRSPENSDSVRPRIVDFDVN